jgi:hypothetical protein
MKGDTHMNTMITRRYLLRFAGLFGVGRALPASPLAAAQKKAAVPAAAAESNVYSSNVAERHGDSLNYRFRGKVSGDTMSGDLDLGEYRTATWTARRQAPSAGRTTA